MDRAWFPPDHLDLPGRLALSRGPGTEDASTTDDLAFLAREGAQHVICLQEAEELRWCVPPETLEQRCAAVAAHGLTFSHHPFEDLTPPSPELARRVVHELEHQLGRGGRVVLHCQAGLGRAGTIAACLFVARGLSAPDAIHWVRWIRPGAIQTDAQEAAVARFADAAPT